MVHTTSIDPKYPARPFALKPIGTWLDNAGGKNIVLLSIVAQIIIEDSDSHSRL